MSATTVSDALFPLPDIQEELERTRDIVAGVPVLGIHAKAYSGKSEAEKFFKATGLLTIAYADRAKAAAQQAFGLTDQEAWDSRYKEIVIERLGMTPREIFQRFGTAICRDQVNLDLWVRNTMRDIANAFDWARDGSDANNWKAPYRGVVITDVRMQNEAEAVRALGGHIIHMTRDDKVVERAAGEYRPTDQDHLSEQTLPMAANDYRVANDGSVDALRDKCARILQTETQRHELPENAHKAENSQAQTLLE